MRVQDLGPPPRSFNISWNASRTDHTDWTPMTVNDTNVIKTIINEVNNRSGENVDWTNARSWLSPNGRWIIRPGIITVESRRIAVGYHLFPHGSIIGGPGVEPRPGPYIVGDVNTRPADRYPPLATWPLGGHMCMYYGFSTGGTMAANDAAKDAFRIGNNLPPDFPIDGIRTTRTTVRQSDMPS